jgi:outer membrane protein
MNRKFSLLTALAAGLLPVVAVSQVSPAPAPSTAPPAQAAPAPVAPQAIPAKIALIVFEQAVIATNEGQRALEDIKKKYEPKKTQLESLNTEIESLKKQLAAAPATMTADERASRQRTIDTKEKQLSRDGEDAQNSYNADLQEAYGKVAQKVDVVLKKYVADNGYTLLIDAGAQQSPIMWAVPETDVTEAVINAYNASSGVAAPPPTAPSAARPKATAPATPRPAAPKPPSQ